MHDGFRFLRCFSLQTKFFKPFHRLPLNLGSNFVVWLPFCEITHRSDQCHYRGLAQGFAGLKTVQPVEKNELPILIAADQDWSLLTHLEDALSDAFHRYGIKALSPFDRNVNLVDWDVLWLAHDCRIKAGNFYEGNSLACEERRGLGGERLQTGNNDVRMPLALRGSSNAPRWFENFLFFGRG